MSNKERHMVIPSVLLMLRQDNKILLIRRSHTGFQDGQYMFPSGHVEKGETPTMAVCREVKEEVGVEVHPGDLHIEQVLYRRGYNAEGKGFDLERSERVDFFFSTTVWRGEPSIEEPDKFDEVQWFSLDDLPENIFPILAEFLNSYPHQKPYTEAGYE